MHFGWMVCVGGHNGSAGTSLCVTIHGGVKVVIIVGILIVVTIANFGNTIVGGRLDLPRTFKINFLNNVDMLHRYNFFGGISGLAGCSTLLASQVGGTSR